MSLYDNGGIVMAWVVVNKKGEEWVFEDRPYLVNGYWETTGELLANRIPKGSIRKLIGKDISFKDAPVELSLGIVHRYKKYDPITEKWYSLDYKNKKGHCFPGYCTKACTFLVDYRQNDEVIWIGDKVYGFTADAVAAYLNSILNNYSL